MVSKPGGRACGTLWAMQRRAVLVHRLAMYAEQRGRDEERLHKLREFCNLVENRIIPHEAFAEAQEGTEFKALMSDLVAAKQQLLAAGWESHYSEKSAAAAASPVSSPPRHSMLRTHENGRSFNADLIPPSSRELQTSSAAAAAEAGGVASAAENQVEGAVPLRRVGGSSESNSGSDSDGWDASSVLSRHSRHKQAAESMSSQDDVTRRYSESSPVDGDDAWRARGGPQGRSGRSDTRRSRSSSHVHRARLQDAIEARERAARHRAKCRSQGSSFVSESGQQRQGKESGELGSRESTPEGTVAAAEVPGRFNGSPDTSLHLHLHDEQQQQPSASGGGFSVVGVTWRQPCASPSEGAQQEGIEINLQPLPLHQQPGGLFCTNCGHPQPGAPEVRSSGPLPDPSLLPPPLDLNQSPGDGAESQPPFGYGGNYVHDHHHHRFIDLIRQEGEQEEPQDDGGDSSDGSPSAIVSFLSDIANGIEAIQEVKALVAGLQVQIDAMQAEGRESPPPSGRRSRAMREAAAKDRSPCIAGEPGALGAGRSPSATARSSPSSPMEDVTSRVANQINALQQPSVLDSPSPSRGSYYYSRLHPDTPGSRSEPSEPQTIGSPSDGKLLADRASWGRLHPSAGSPVLCRSPSGPSMPGQRSRQRLQHPSRSLSGALHDADIMGSAGSPVNLC